MDLKHLKALTESSEVDRSQERKRREWFDRLAVHLEKADKIIHGARIDEILKAGNFPETEHKAFRAAWDKFQSEFDDLKYALLQEYDPD